MTWERLIGSLGISQTSRHGQRLYEGWRLDVHWEGFEELRLPLHLYRIILACRLAVNASSRAVAVFALTAVRHIRPYIGDHRPRSSGHLVPEQFTQKTHDP